MKTCILILTFVICAVDAGAQLAIDTTGQLDSVMVLAKAIRPLGQPSIIQSKAWQTGKLATSSTEALLYLPGVHIRQQGPGQIATVQYRGLQGARVAQTWQGVPVTNPQLGTGDVHELNLALVDQIEIGSPSNLGNAAAVSVTQSAASPTTFSARFANGNGFLVNGQWKGLRMVFQNDQHEFSHVENSFDKKNDKTKQPGITTKSIGGSYTADLGRNWSSSTYYLQTDRRYTTEFFGDHGVFSIKQKLKTSSARQLFTYVSENTSESVDIGVLYDRQLYERGFGTRSEGQTFQPLIRYRSSVKKGLSFTTDNRILFSNHSNYTKSAVKPETRTLANYTFNPSTIQVKATGGFHTRLNSGSIAFGTVTFLKKVNRTEHVQFELKRIGRLPSLDDQLWNQGGIENLSVERGWGISSSSESRLGLLTISPVIFARRFGTYILWLPRDNFFNPTNLEKVNNYGAGLDISGQIGSTSKNLNFLGSMSYSELRLAEDFELPRGNFLVANKDLPFSPRFTGNFTLDYQCNAWSILVQGRYTGKQFSSYNGLSEYDEFAVLRTAISHRSKIVSVSLSADNITNTIIPTDFGLFSPLRRFELTVNHTPKL